MATAFVFILLLIVAVLAHLKYLRPAKWLFGCTLLLFWLVGSGLAGKFILPYVQRFPVLSHPHWQTNNAIIILGGGSVQPPLKSLAQPTSLAYSRILEGARLYFQCKTKKVICKIIVTGGDPMRVGKSESEVYKWKLISLNVPQADILTEMKSFNTYQNARFTKAIVDKYHFDHLLLVTSNMHMARSLTLFKLFNMDAEASASDYVAVKVSYLPTGYHFAIMDFVLHEMIGAEQIKFYNAMGWNKKA